MATRAASHGLPSLTVVRTRHIAAPVKRLWRCLTVPALMAQWFADVDRLEPRYAFEFRLGDGDFFKGRVLEWKEPRLLRLEWRFLAIGPRFHVAYRIESAPPGQHSILTTTDRGAPTAEYARRLAEGWDDFLDRLERFVYTGRSARFAWNPILEATAVVPARARTRRHVPAFGGEWLQGAFPAVAIAPREGGGWTFRDPAWNGAATHVRLDVRHTGAADLLNLEHGGWSALREEQRLSERRRYAGLWQRALARIERGLES